MGHINFTKKFYGSYKFHEKILWDLKNFLLLTFFFHINSMKKINK